jgi:DNA polymerase III subunit chi
VTRIDFYLDADDRLTVACRLAVKALQQSLRVLVYAPDSEVANRVDRLLWTASPTGFVPHCMVENRLAAETPVLIARTADALPHDQLLLNLDHDWPPAFARFQRLIEVVGRDEEDKQRARGRYKFYRDRGYAINTHALTDG